MVWQSLKNETDMRVTLNFRRENENISPISDVLQKFSNLPISRCCFADDGKELDKNEKRTCRACKAIVFAHEICKFVTFSLPSPVIIRDFKIGDYGLPTVGREAFGTGTRQRVLP